MNVVIFFTYIYIYIYIYIVTRSLWLWICRFVLGEGELDLVAAVISILLVRAHL